MKNLLDQLHAALLSCNGAEIIRIAEQIDWEYRVGKIVELPCKVGDTVYWLNNWYRTYGDYKIDEAIVSKVNATVSGLWVGFYSGENVSEGQFNKTVFLTRAAAEQALKERET